MYSSKPAFVLGFHGLDEEIGRQILNGEAELRHSTNRYDWLGHGVYFWENSPERARQWAEQASKRRGSKIKKPFVIGAVLDLGNCLDLLDKRWLDFLRAAYDDMLLGLTDDELPTNKPFGTDDFDFKQRELDCAVIRHAVELAKMWENLAKTGNEVAKAGNIKKFDSVRAAFWEGEDLYPNAGFKTHNHIQLSIMNTNCIKGIFLPRDRIDF